MVYSNIKGYMDESTAEHVAVAQVLLDELKPITKDPLKFELLGICRMI